MAAGSSYGVYITDANGHETVGSVLQFTDSVAQPQPSANPVTAGALATTSAWVSGTAKQISATQQVTLYVLLTGDATNNAATCTVALSPDNSTFSTVFAVSLAAAVNNTGAITVPVTLVMPLAWYVKLTLAHMTAGAGTYA